MARTITAGMVTEIIAEKIMPILLVKLEFDSGDLNMWSGIGDLVFGGDTYTGTGDLGRISTITETKETQATGIELQLSGMNNQIVSLALTEDFQDRTVRVWLGALDTSTFVLISDPILMFVGRLDLMRIDEGPDTSTINVTAENRLIDLERPKRRRWTTDDQKLRSPDDTGFEQVPKLQDAEVVFGKA